MSSLNDVIIEQATLNKDEWLLSNQGGFLAYYNHKMGICRSLAPTSILEIGVRAGYSALAFLWSNPAARKYIGIDIGKYPGNPDLTQKVKRARSLLMSRFPQVQVDISIQNSLEIDLLADKPRVDFSHIDGEHSYDGVLHDLFHCCSRSSFVLVDDVDPGSEVQYALMSFLAGQPGIGLNTYPAFPGAPHHALLEVRSFRKPPPERHVFPAGRLHSGKFRREGL